ncbi:MAG: hypothetical protein LBI48_00950 [Burkholderiaceae bacterium]|jgi:hypothetical protein|nr:hypothetical protein [Burkholderiaceae bacterium]
MKPLALLLLMLVVVWLWRRERRIVPPGAAARRRPGSPPQPMLSCPVCGTHVPACDAVAGLRASYCCARHRREAEG